MTTLRERGRWDAATYDKTVRYVSDLGAPVLGLLDPKPGEKILDLGCGDGALTVKIRDAGAEVTGVDGNANMLAAARALGLRVHHRDGRALDFRQEFDAVFSNAALHWMVEADGSGPEAVIAGVAQALKPGGRFVGEFGGLGNIAAIRVAMDAVLSDFGLKISVTSPKYFPSVAEYRRKLESGGFRVEEIALIPRPTPLPAGMTGWLDALAGEAFEPLSPQDRLVARERVIALLKPQLCDSDGNWFADYVRLRFRAVLV